MRFFVFLAFCLVVRADVIEIGLAIATSGIEDVRQAIGPLNYLSNEDPRAGARIANFGRKYGIGLRDNEEVVTNKNNFVYPCGRSKNNYNYECIRKFFAKNSDCSPVRGRVPDPLVLPQYTAYFPIVSMTGTYSNVTFAGLSKATICTFNYNKKTGTLVFAIEIPVIYSTSPEVYFVYKSPCREDIVKSGFANTTYRSLIFTARIPLVSPFGKLRLDLSDIRAYIGDPIPEVTLDPALTDSTNPVVVAAVQKLFNTLPFVEKELFFILSQLLTAVYIQTNICDFGVELFSI